jgi:DNA-binding phage protein
MRARNQTLLRIKDIIPILRREVERAGSQAEWARKTGANRANLNSTLTGKRPPTRDILRALNLRKVFAYERASGARDRSR